MMTPDMGPVFQPMPAKPLVKVPEDVREAAVLIANWLQREYGQIVTVEGTVEGTTAVHPDSPGGVVLVPCPDGLGAMLAIEGHDKTLCVLGRL